MPILDLFLFARATICETPKGIESADRNIRCERSCVFLRCRSKIKSSQLIAVHIWLRLICLWWPIAVPRRFDDFGVMFVPCSFVACVFVASRRLSRAFSVFLFIALYLVFLVLASFFYYVQQSMYACIRFSLCTLYSSSSFIYFRLVSCSLDCC